LGWNISLWRALSVCVTGSWCSVLGLGGLYWAAAAVVTVASAGIVSVLTMEGQYGERTRWARRSQTISLTSGAEKERERERARTS